MKVRCYAIIDSGTSYYSASRNFVKKLSDELKINQFCQNYDLLPNIIITLKSSQYDQWSGKTFNLTLNRFDYVTKHDMNLKIEENKEMFKMNKCEFDFISYNSMADKNLIILGLKFLRKYYTIFDYERKIIGFSEYKTNKSVKIKNYNEIVKSNSELDVLIEDWTKVFG
jgi:hypothetical protein